MEKDIKNVVYFCFAFLIVLAFLYVINPISRDATGIYIILTIIALTAYLIKTFKSYLIGIPKKTFGKSTIWALIFGGGFYLVTKFIPGFSLGLPTLPNAISDQLKFFIVVMVAPVIETLAFQGAIFGYFLSINKLRKYAVIIQAIVFASFHIASYVSGFYNYPNFAVGLQAITANIFSFVSAFMFALIAGIFVKDKIRNLWFVMLFHLILNLIVFTKLSII
jgi:hypothetical protein